MISPHPFNNLGGKRRDLQAAPITEGEAAPYNFPATKAKPANRTYYFQGQQPACGAHAGTSFSDSLDIQNGVTPVPNNTPRDVWININANGQDPNGGTTMDRIFAVLSTTGVVPFEPLENNVTFDIADYADLDALTPTVLAQQGKNLIVNPSYPKDISFNGIKQAIYDHGAVLLLIDVCARFWTAADGTTSWAAADVLPLAPPSAEFPVIDGHFIVADYYDENYIYGPNSFSQQWGLDGDFQFGQDYMPWVIELGVAEKLSTSNVNVAIQQAIPVVESAIHELPNVPQPQRTLMQQTIQAIINTLTSLL